MNVTLGQNNDARLLFGKNYFYFDTLGYLGVISNANKLSDNINHQDNMKAFKADNT